MLRGFRGPFIYAEKHVLLRHMLMVILFAVVCSAFWYSFEDTFKAIRADRTYFDETKTTTKEDMEKYKQLSECLNQTWDINTVIHIRNGGVHIPSIQRNTLFIGVSSTPGQTVVIFPPLVRRMFSKKVIQSVETEIDHCVQTSSSLPLCAINALDKVHELLSDPEVDYYK